MMPLNENMIVEQSRRFITKREELHRNYRFITWSGGIGFIIMVATLASAFYPKLQSSTAPGILMEGVVYGFVGTLALFGFSIMAAGLILSSLRAKIDVDYARHALLVKYYDTFIAASSAPVIHPKNP